MLQKIINNLKEVYKRPFDDIKLQRDMIGLVCMVSAGKERYILKLFRSKHTNQALQSIEIMRYLYEFDYPVPHIILTSSDNSYFIYDDQGENRIGVLYEYIHGIEPDKNRNIEKIGRQTGKLHLLMNQYNMNLCCHEKTFFIDRYINIINAMKYPNVDKFIEYGDRLWKSVENLPRRFCHGDYHTGNMLINTKGQYVLLDFDAAANAFPTYDIAVISDSTDYFSYSTHMYSDTAHMLDRFLKGYLEYNMISEEEISRVYDFIAIRHFEVQATIIENLGLSCVDKEFIDHQYEWLMKWDSSISHN